MQPLKTLRHPILWGVMGLVVATAVAVVAGLLYVAPPGQKTIIFYTHDAASIHAGDQVRIAGVGVGKVKDLALEQRQVRVTARVDGYAFIGNQSQVDIRMLTVVGGYYVNIISLGDTPLGVSPIPIERVKMPYNLVQVLTDSTKITDHVATKPIEESLNQLQKGLTGDNIASISSIIGAGNGLMSTIEHQRGQITDILRFSNKYLQSLNDFSDGIRSLVRKTSIAEQVLVLYGEQLRKSVDGLAGLMNAMAPLAYFYTGHRAKVLEKMRNWLQKARMYSEHNGLLVRELRAMRNKITRLLDAQNAPPELLATDLCIPTPGTSC